jgi:group I intron endonuclease
MQAIYQIKNLKNGKLYVGSTNNLTKRWANHRSKLRNNKHENNYLQLAWNKYGEESFEFSLLEEVNDENRIDKEIYYLNQIKSYERDIGYNFDKNPIDKSGANNPFYGKKHNDSAKEKLREIANNRSEELKKKMGAKNKGKGSKLNLELARKIREEYASGNETYGTLMNRYNVANGTIQAVLHNKIWVD